MVANSPRGEWTRPVGKNAAAGRVLLSRCGMEEILLRRILNGHLRLVEGQYVEYYHYGNRRWYRKKPRQYKGRWTFVFGENRTTVYRNRLVWMIVNKKKIPDDHHVDHADEDKTNDDPNNLRLMPISESHSQGNGIQTGRAFHSLWNWFHFVGLYGREPTEEEQADDSLLFA